MKHDTGASSVTGVARKVLKWKGWIVLASATATITIFAAVTVPFHPLINNFLLLALALIAIFFGRSASPAFSARLAYSFLVLASAALLALPLSKYSDFASFVSIVIAVGGLVVIWNVLSGHAQREVGRKEGWITTVYFVIDRGSSAYDTGYARGFAFFVFASVFTLIDLMFNVADLFSA